MATGYKPTLKGLALTVGVGAGVFLSMALVLTYMETGSWYQTAEAVRKFEEWWCC